MHNSQLHDVGNGPKDFVMRLCGVPPDISHALPLLESQVNNLVPCPDSCLLPFMGSANVDLVVE
eukprot:scaffold79_cov145-Amphora_coffeaeformis.AAC.7